MLTAFVENLGSPGQELVRHLLWVEDESLDELIRRFDLIPPPGSWQREKYLPKGFLFKVDYNEQVRLQPGFDSLFRALLPRPEIEEKTWEGDNPRELLLYAGRQPGGASETGLPYSPGWGLLQAQI